MSHYLRRLIDTAAGRGDSVRPLTGSIFSPNEAPLQSAEVGESVSAFTTPAARGSAFAADPGGSRDDSANPPHTPLLPPAAPSISLSRRELPQRPRKAQGEQAFDVDELPTGAPHARREAQPESERDESIRNRLPLEHNDDSGRRAAGDGYRISRPLMTPSGLTGLSRSEAPMPRERTVVQGAREPDEIQIHIGRIEVIAMQQPAAPRPAKTQPQSMTLDGYLSRRDGKSR
jgi:hypothetical protein